jgi:hypothetical protein
MCSKLSILPFEVHVEHAGGDSDDPRATSVMSSVPCSRCPDIDASSTTDGSGSETETDDSDDDGTDSDGDETTDVDHIVTGCDDNASDSDSDSQSATTESDDESDDGHFDLDERINYFVRYPQLEVRASQQAPGAGLGVFVRDGYTLEPWDAIPLVGKPVSESECAAQVADGDAHYLVAVPGGIVDGDPAGLPHCGVGMRGAAIWAMVNEPRTTKMNTTFMGGFLVVAKRLRAGDELLVSYGADYVRNYSVSRYVKSKYARFPRLED